MQVADTIRGYFASAKGAKRRVAEFFILNLSEIPVLTLDEIARRIDASASTVTRVASEMGFQGFPDLQRKIWEFNRASLAPSARMDANRGSSELTADNSLQQEIRNISQLTSLNSMANIDAAAAEIAQATDVHVLGVRTASTISSFFFYALSKIRSRVYNWGLGDVAPRERYLEIGEGSVLFVASFPRYSEISITAAAEVCGRKGGVISLADGPSSPLAPYSRVALYAPYESVSYFNSMTAPLALTNFLMVKINALLGERGKEHLMQYEELLSSAVAVKSSK